MSVTASQVNFDGPDALDELMARPGPDTAAPSPPGADFAAPSGAEPGDALDDLLSSPPAPRPGLVKAPGLWQKTKATGQEMGRALWNAPTYMKAGTASILEGNEPLRETDWKDKAIQAADALTREQVQRPDAAEPTLIGTRGDWRQNAESIANSLGLMGGSLATDTAARALLGKGLLGSAAGFGLAGLGAYEAMKRQDENRVIRQGLEQMTQAREAQGLPGPMPGELQAEQTRLQPFAERHGQVEGGLETVSTILDVAIFNRIPGARLLAHLPGGKVLAKVPGGAAAGRLGTTFAGEMATETPTQILQGAIESEAGLSDRSPRSLASLSDWLAAGEEVLPAVAQTSLMLGLGGETWHGGKNWLAKRRAALDAKRRESGGALPEDVEGAAEAPLGAEQADALDELMGSETAAGQPGTAIPSEDITRYPKWEKPAFTDRGLMPEVGPGEPTEPGGPPAVPPGGEDYGQEQGQGQRRRRQKGLLNETPTGPAEAEPGTESYAPKFWETMAQRGIAAPERPESKEELDRIVEAARSIKDIEARLAQSWLQNVARRAQQGSTPADPSGRQIEAMARDLLQQPRAGVTIEQAPPAGQAPVAEGERPPMRRWDRASDLELSLALEQGKAQLAQAEVNALPKQAVRAVKDHLVSIAAEQLRRQHRQRQQAQERALLPAEATSDEKSSEPVPVPQGGAQSTPPPGAQPTLPVLPEVRAAPPQPVAVPEPGRAGEARVPRPPAAPAGVGGAGEPIAALPEELTGKGEARTAPGQSGRGLLPAEPSWLEPLQGQRSDTKTGEQGQRTDLISSQTQPEPAHWFKELNSHKQEFVKDRLKEATGLANDSGNFKSAKPAIDAFVKAIENGSSPDAAWKAAQLAMPFTPEVEMAMRKVSGSVKMAARRSDKHWRLNEPQPLPSPVPGPQPVPGGQGAHETPQVGQDQAAQAVKRTAFKGNWERELSRIEQERKRLKTKEDFAYDKAVNDKGASLRAVQAEREAIELQFEDAKAAQLGALIRDGKVAVNQDGTVKGTQRSALAKYVNQYDDVASLFTPEQQAAITGNPVTTQPKEKPHAQQIEKAGKIHGGVQPRGQLPELPAEEGEQGFQPGGPEKRHPQEGRPEKALTPWEKPAAIAKPFIPEDRFREKPARPKGQGLLPKLPPAEGVPKAAEAEYAKEEPTHPFEIGDMVVVRGGRYNGTVRELLEITPTGYRVSDTGFGSVLVSNVELSRKQAKAEARPKTTEPEAPKEQPGSSEPGEFEEGDRVVLSGHHDAAVKGRHGVVVKKQAVTWKTAVIDITGQGIRAIPEPSSRTVSYEIRTDNGAEVHAYDKGLEAETGAAPTDTVPDIQVDGQWRLPNQVWSGAKYAMQAAKSGREAAARARKPDKKAALLEGAKNREATAKLNREAFEAWAAQYPEAALEASSGEWKPAAKETPSPQPSPAGRGGETAPAVKESTLLDGPLESKNPKTGKPLYVVTIKTRVERAEYERLLGIAQKHHGYYFSGRRVRGAIPGFTFNDKADAAEFMNAVEPGTAEAIAEPVEQLASDEVRPDRHNPYVYRKQGDGWSWQVRTFGEPGRPDWNGPMQLAPEFQAELEAKLEAKGGQVQALPERSSTETGAGTVPQTAEQQRRQDGWRDNLIKTRLVAQSLKIPISGKTHEQLLASIDLADRIQALKWMAAEEGRARGYGPRNFVEGWEKRFPEAQGIGGGPAIIEIDVRDDASGRRMIHVDLNLQRAGERANVETAAQLRQTLDDYEAKIEAASAAAKPQPKVTPQERMAGEGKLMDAMEAERKAILARVNTALDADQRLAEITRGILREPSNRDIYDDEVFPKAFNDAIVSDMMERKDSLNQETGKVYDSIFKSIKDKAWRDETIQDYIDRLTVGEPKENTTETTAPADKLTPTETPAIAEEGQHEPVSGERAGVPARPEAGGVPATPGQRRTEGSARPGEPRGEGTGGRDHGRKAEGSGGPGLRGEGEGTEHVPVRGPRTGQRGNVRAAKELTGENYRISEADGLGQGGWKTKAKDNIEAIRTLKAILAEERPATREEQAKLVKYVGWGASELANNMFEQWRYPKTGYKGFLGYGEGYENLGAELKELLSPEEYRLAKDSTTAAHYTAGGIVSGMWHAAQRLGFTQGKILEPGSGIGHFIGLVPDELVGRVRFTGVERDATSAAIAKLLYPQHDIRPLTYEKFVMPNGFYDLAIGNPPFGDTKILSDPDYAKLKLPIHDYFFVKTMDKVRPGGLMMFVTSRYTMDKQGDRARNALMKQADLIGAIRLPETAFKQNAGTDVVTDVLFFRKRLPGEVPAGAAWGETRAATVGDEQVAINEYFVDHPEMILGTPAMTGSMYGKNQYTVQPNTETPLEDQFRAAVERLPALAMAPDLIDSPGSDEAASIELNLAPTNIKEGAYYVGEDGKLYAKEKGVGVAVDKPAAVQQRIRDFIPLRDAVRGVLWEQLRQEGTDASLKAAQARLREAYDAFAAKYGPINREQTITVSKAGKESVQTRYPNFSPLRDDPDAYLVASIERYDADTDTATPADIFTKRVIRPESKPEINSTTDALHVTLHERGAVDLPLIAQIMGKSEEQVIEELGDAVYFDPSSQRWQTDDEYLSGNVRHKLAMARAAAEFDGSLARNVTALEAVQPVDKTPGELANRVHLGMPIVKTEWLEQFMRSLGLRAAVSHLAKNGDWAVVATDKGDTRRTTATADWGTNRRNAFELLDDALNARTIRITDTVRNPDGSTSTVFNKDATQAANEKLGLLKKRFKEWVWEDVERATELTAIYNQTYNNIVPRVFGGEHIKQMQFPGMSAVVNPFEHQKRVAWRIVQTGNTYMGHSVGAGKTIGSILAGMEMKRLGIKKKPIWVVPRHMLKQFSAEFLELYPAAKIMVADEEQFEKSKRQRFMGRVATENWDGIIITHSAFKYMAMKPEFVEQYINAQLAELRDMLESLDSGERLKRKQIERQIKKMEQRLDKALSQAGKDLGVSFEDAGIDQIFVDEAQEFRKLDIVTNQTGIKGIDPNGSEMAQDLYLKSRYLEQLYPHRSLVLMSGTPVTNTIGEIYTLQRYLQPEALEAAGVDNFDAWTATFGDMKTQLEATPAGNYAPSTRFARFRSLGALQAMVSEILDFVHAKDLAYLKRPKVREGGRQIIQGEQTETQKAYKKVLAARLKAIKERKGPPQKGQDIILSVITDGRHAAMDERFVRPSLPPNPNSKLEKLIDKVHEIWHNTADERLTQMIFADEGLPQAKAQRGFSAYLRIKERLIELGVPADEIAFIQDYTQTKAKKKLFDQVNAGEVRILIGSSEAMGTGVNAQKRLVALHHLDADKYLPSNIEQREGRIVRQGNQNEWVDLFVYVNKGSFDETMWQFLETKQGFIDDFLSGSGVADEAEDIDGGADSFALARAMSSDNPLVLERAGIEADLERLESLKRGHADEQYRLRRTLAENEHSIKVGEKNIKDLTAALKTRVSTRGDEFSMTVGKGKVRYDSRADGGESLLQHLKALVDPANLAKYPEGTYPVAELGGAQLTAELKHGRYTTREKGQKERVEIVPELTAPIRIGQVSKNLFWRANKKELDNAEGFNTVRQIERWLDGLDGELADGQRNIEKMRRDNEEIKPRIGKPYQYEDELQQKRARLAVINTELQKEEAAEEAPAAEGEEGEKPQFSRGARYTIEGSLQDYAGEPDLDLFNASAKSGLRGYSITREEADRLFTAGVHGLFRLNTQGPDTTGLQGWFLKDLALLGYRRRLNYQTGMPVTEDPGIVGLIQEIRAHRDYVGFTRAPVKLGESVQSQPITAVVLRPGTVQPKGLYRRGGTAGAGTAQAIRRALLKGLGAGVSKLEQAGVLNIVTVAELDPEIKAWMRGDEEGAYWRGKAYLIADNLSPSRAVEVALHEVGEHYGLERMIGADAYRGLQERIRQLHAEGNARVVAAWDAVMREYRDEQGRPFYQAGSHKHLAEVIARLGEQGGLQESWWKALLARIKAFLLRQGLVTKATLKRLTDADLNALLVASVRHAAKTGAPSLYPVQAQASKPAGVFYSELAQQLGQVKATKAPAAQWKAIIAGLKQKGVKQDEIEWSGVNDWLDLAQGPVSREDVQAFLEGNGVRVDEVVKGGIREQTLSDQELTEYDELTELDRVGDLPSGQVARLRELRERARQVVQGTSTKFNQWQLPGGENYKELLMTLPVNQNAAAERRSARVKELAARHQDLIRQARDMTPGAERAELQRQARNTQTQIDMAMRRTDDPAAFKSSHFDEPNILAHVRFNERTDADGKRVLFIEEIQSDWGQKAKKEGVVGGPVAEPEGFKWSDKENDWLRVPDAEATHWKVLGEGGDALWETPEQAIEAVKRYRDKGTRGVPRAPFITDTKAWVALALKRAIRYAADNGFERIAWTTGEQQAERYDLSKRITEIRVRKGLASSEWYVQALGLQGENVLGRHIQSLEELDDLIGKEAADKARQQINDHGEAKLTGLDLKVGGQGMRGFYDAIVPQVANQLLKKFGGGKVGAVTLGSKTADDIGDFLAGVGVKSEKPESGLEQPGFEITPALRDRALQGLPLFRRGEGRPSPIGDGVRLARARAQGYDTSQRWFHGTPIGNDIRAFDLGKVGGRTGTRENAIFLTDNPEVAGAYGYQEETVLEGMEAREEITGGSILPLYIRGKLYDASAEVDGRYRKRKFEELLAKAKAEGYAGVDFGTILDVPAGTPYGAPEGRVVAMFKPSDIRSINAEFDPRRSGLDDLLFSRPGSREEPSPQPSPAGSGGPESEADRLFAEIDKAAQETDWERTRRSAEQRWQTLGKAFKRQWLGGLSVGQLVEVGGELLPRMQEYLTQQREMGATRQGIFEAVDSIARDWEKLDAQGARNRIEQNRVAAVMHEATLAGVDPSVAYRPVIDIAEGLQEIGVIKRRIASAPGQRNEPWFERIEEIKRKIAQERRRVQSQDRLSQLYQALSPAGKAIYQAARDYHEAQSRRVEAALIALIEDAVISRKARQAAIAALRAEFETARVEAPYFPLARWGDYWVSVQTPGRNREFHLFQTIQEQEAFMAQARAEGHAIVGRGKQLENIRELGGVAPDFVMKVEQAIGELGNHPLVAQVRDQVWQLYLQTLPDMSVRRHQIHRKKTPGFGKDALRAFAEKGYHDAYQYARLKHGVKIRQVMTDLQEDLKAGTTAGVVAKTQARLALLEAFKDEVWGKLMPGAVGDRAAQLRALAREGEADEAEAERWEAFAELAAEASQHAHFNAWLNGQIDSLKTRLETARRLRARPRGYEFAADSVSELQQAYQHLMTPNTSPLANWANQFGYLWYLAFSPSAWVVNALQAPIFSIPYVAARFGVGAAGAAFASAYRRAFTRDPDFLFSIRSTLKGDTAKAYDRAVAQQLIDRTRAHDLAGLAEEGTIRSGMNRKFYEAMSAGFHHAERLNRETTFVASFELAHTNGASFSDAFAYAAEVVDKTHFNYAAENRPRFLRGDVARVIGQFKLYAQGVTYLVWKSFAEAFLRKGTPAEVKREARRFLALHAGTQLAVGGLMGLPMGAAWVLLKALMDGDDDDPQDFEGNFRQAFAELFGKTGGAAATTGLVNALTPIDLHSRVSERELWIREEDKQVEGRDAAYRLMASLLGPMAGLVENFAVGTKLASEGQVWRAAEKFSPNVVNDALKALRYAREGVKTSKGDTLVADLTAAELFLQGLGFTPARVSERYAENAARKGIEQRLLQRRQQLMRQFGEARRAQDATAQREAVTNIGGFNRAHPEMGIGPGNLAQSLRSQAAMRKRALDGVPVMPRTRALLKEQFEFARE